MNLFIRRELFVMFMLSLSLFLGSCGGDQTTNPPTTNPPTTNPPTTNPPTTPEPQGYEINGQVQDWPYGKMALKAVSYDENNGSEIVVAESNISANGSFTMILPSASKSFSDAFYDLTTVSCEEWFEGSDPPVTDIFGEGFTSTPNPIRLANSIDFLAYENAAASYPLVYLELEKLVGVYDGILVRYIFSEVAGSTVGNCSGEWEGIQESYSRNNIYSLGWNSRVLSYSGDENTYNSSTTIADVPADVTWQYYDIAPPGPGSGGVLVSTGVEPEFRHRLEH